jgi:hypothetical protein
MYVLLLLLLLLLHKKTRQNLCFCISRGLCTILRTQAGGQNRFSRPEDDDDDGDDNDDNFNYRNNSHWLPGLLEERARKRDRARCRLTRPVPLETGEHFYGCGRTPGTIMAGGDGDGDDDDDDDDDDEILQGPDKSNYVQYYDATSLYPSSGEYHHHHHHHHHNFFCTANKNAVDAAAATTFRPT